MGPLAGLTILYPNGERKLGFQRHEGKSAFFKMLKTFLLEGEESYRSRMGSI